MRFFHRDKVKFSILLGVVLASGSAYCQDAASTQHMTYTYGSGSWGTLANLFFLLSALFTDILHIRIMLVAAYISLVLQTALGFPGPTIWGQNPHMTSMQLGNILWFTLALTLQVYGLLVLVLDEWPPNLQGDDEMLWRLFYRRCGITKREFSHVLKVGHWQHHKAGELIERRDRDEPKASIIFKGAVRLEDSKNLAPVVHLASGQLLNIYLGNLFGIYMGFEEDPDQRNLVIAETDVTLFSWDVPALLKMASGSVSVAVPGYWRSLLLNVLALQYNRQQLNAPPYSSFGTPEPDPQAWCAGLVQTVDMTEPLRPEECDQVTLKSVLHGMFGSLSIKVPRGIRHQPRPKTGAMATARVLLAAHMRRRQQSLPRALSESLDAALAKADQQVVLQLSSSLGSDILPGQTPSVAMKQQQQLAQKLDLCERQQDGLTRQDQQHQQRPSHAGVASDQAASMASAGGEGAQASSADHYHDGARISPFAVADSTNKPSSK